MICPQYDKLKEMFQFDLSELMAHCAVIVVTSSSNSQGVLGMVKASFFVVFSGSIEKWATEQANRETFMCGAVGRTAGIHTHWVTDREKKENIWKKQNIYFVWRESICFQESLELHLVIYFSPQHTYTNINCLCVISHMLLECGEAIIKRL